MKKILTIGAMLLSLMAFAGPKDDINKANELLKNNKTQEAIKLLEASKYVKGEENEFAEIQLFLSANSKDLNQNITYLLNAAIASITSPASIKARRELATISAKLIQAKRDNEAKAIDDAIYAASGKNKIITGDYYTDLENILYILKLDDKAKEYETKALNLKDNNISSAAYYFTGINLLNKNDLNGGIAYLKKAESFENTNASVEATKLLLNLSKNPQEKALYLEKLVKLNEFRNTDSFALLGLLYTQSKNTKALKDLDDKISKENKNVLGAYELTLGDLLIKSNYITEGFSYLNKARKLGNKEIIESDLIFTKYYLSKKDEKSAIKMANEAIALDPKNDKLEFQTFINFLNYNKIDLGYKYIVKAVELNPKNIVYVENAFATAVVTNNSKDAKKYEAILRKDFKYKDRDIANIYLSIGRVDNAIKLLEKSAKTQSIDYLSLSLVYANYKKDYNKALFYAKKAQQLKLKDADNVIKQIEALMKKSK